MDSYTVTILFGDETQEGHGVTVYPNRATALAAFMRATRGELAAHDMDGSFCLEFVREDGTLILMEVVS